MMVIIGLYITVGYYQKHCSVFWLLSLIAVTVSALNVCSGPSITLTLFTADCPEINFGDIVSFTF